MKLMYETTNVDSFQDINESTGEKKYKIKGIFSTIGEKNRNGRIYPSNIWESEVSRYQNNFSSGSMNTLMEYQHPNRTEVDPMEAVAKIEKLYIKGKYVMGEATLLNNSKANQIKSLIDVGIKIAVSSRGVGKVNNGIVEDYRLITYDIVTNQSDYSAEMFGITEGILESKEFEVQENGLINEVQMCTESACHLFEVEDIQKATKEKFDQLIDQLSGKKIEINESGSDIKYSWNDINAALTKMGMNPKDIVRVASALNKKKINEI